jgi:hypothetical protein
MNRFLSIDEFKASALVLVLLIDIVAIVVWLFLHGTVPQPLIDLALGIIYSIAGVNAVNSIKAIVPSNTNAQVNNNTNASLSQGQNKGV